MFPLAERRRSRTYQPWGYHGLPVFELRDNRDLTRRPDGCMRDRSLTVAMGVRWSCDRCSLRPGVRPHHGKVDVGMAVGLVFETYATTEDNEAGKATGWLSGQLSNLGREQARDLGRRRTSDGLAAIFSSDLRRAIETVEIAFPDPTIPVLYDWRLRGCDYGIRNGYPVETLERVRHVDLPYPEGESWRQAVTRVRSFTLD
jgi:2,3-bisphosphoglycerate-dependent phosphoglycerate mutase